MKRMLPIMTVAALVWLLLLIPFGGCPSKSSKTESTPQTPKVSVHSDGHGDEVELPRELSVAIYRLVTNADAKVVEVFDRPPQMILTVGDEEYYLYGTLSRTLVQSKDAGDRTEFTVEKYEIRGDGVALVCQYLAALERAYLDLNAPRVREHAKKIMEVAQ